MGVAQKMKTAGLVLLALGAVAAVALLGVQHDMDASPTGRRLLATVEAVPTTLRRLLQYLSTSGSFTMSVGENGMISTSGSFTMSSSESHYAEAPPVEADFNAAQSEEEQTVQEQAASTCSSDDDCHSGG